MNLEKLKSDKHFEIIGKTSLKDIIGGDKTPSGVIQTDTRVDKDQNGRTIVIRTYRYWDSDEIDGKDICYAGVYYCDEIEYD